MTDTRYGVENLQNFNSIEARVFFGSNIKH